jgi:hypothetical protein
MALIPIQHTAVLGGLNPSWLLASAAGDGFGPNNGTQTLLVRNQGAAPLLLTVAAVNPCNQNSLHPLAFTVPAIGLAPVLLGTFLPQFYNDGNGNVNWTYAPTILPPTTAPVVAAGAAGTPNGTYACQVTFVTPTGESVGSPVATVVVASQQIAWSTIPIGPAGTTARRLYRSLLSAADAAAFTESVSINAGAVSTIQPAAIAPSGRLWLVTTIADNLATVFTDNVADTALGAAIPVTNTQVAVIAA